MKNIVALPSFTVDGEEFFIITPDHSIEDVLFHLAEEVSEEDVWDGIEHLETILRTAGSEV